MVVEGRVEVMIVVGVAVEADVLDVVEVEEDAGTLVVDRLVGLLVVEVERVLAFLVAEDTVAVQPRASPGKSW